MTTETTNKRKTYVGEVVSNKMQSTVVVRVTHLEKHPRYGKVVKRAKKFYAHHEGEQLQEGSLVKISETRPLSKMKRFRVVETNVAVQEAAS